MRSLDLVTKKTYYRLVWLTIGSSPLLCGWIVYLQPERWMEAVGGVMLFTIVWAVILLLRGKYMEVSHGFDAQDEEKSIRKQGQKR